MSNEPGCPTTTQVEPGSVIAKIRSLNCNLVDIRIALVRINSRLSGVDEGADKGENVPESAGSIGVANSLLRVSDELAREISTHVKYLEDAADAIDPQPEVKSQPMVGG